MKRPLSSRRLLLLSAAAAMIHQSSGFTANPWPSRTASPRPLHVSSPGSETATSTSSPPPLLHSFHQSLHSLYDRTQLSIKCPFLRRRVADCLDGAASLLHFLLIRHKSLGLSDPDLLPVIMILPGCKAAGRHFKTTHKEMHLPLSCVASRIESDWKRGGGRGRDDNHADESTHKGYYITGRLDTTIYRDDCLFTGPDPDMPVRGLRKYLSASAQLFDSKSSFAVLDSISMQDRGGDKKCGVVTVHWTLGGVINLPWHPVVEPWSGWTKYHVDEEGLIYFHEEGWDVEVWRIFLSVLFPIVRWVDWIV